MSAVCGAGQLAELLTAIESDDLQAVQRVLTSRAGPYVSIVDRALVRSVRRPSALEAAIRGGHLAAVRFLVTTAGAKTVDNPRSSPLEVALLAALSPTESAAYIAKRVAILRWLFEEGFTDSVRSFLDGNLPTHHPPITPLRLACRSNVESVVATLLAAGSDTDESTAPATASMQTKTILGEAVVAKSRPIVNMLLQAGAPLLPSIPGHRSALAEACSGQSLLMVQLLVEQYGADVNQHVPDEESPLIAAITAGCDSTVKWLLEPPRSASTERIAFTVGETALHVACRMQYVCGVQTLLAAGADVCFPLGGQDLGPTALHYAVAHCESVAGPEIIAALVSDSREDVLNQMARYDVKVSPPIPAPIIDASSPDTSDESRKEMPLSPLQLACVTGAIPAIDALISCHQKKGIDIDKEDDTHGYSPLQLASLFGRQDAVRKLLTYGEVNPTRCSSVTGLSAVTCAVQGNHAGVVQLFLSLPNVATCSDTLRYSLELANATGQERIAHHIKEAIMKMGIFKFLDADGDGELTMLEYEHGMAALEN